MAARQSEASRDPYWYKDAVIYQVHVKSFFDDNNDGIGDFRGLLRKLDYIEALGVTAIWLLPFYPSPMRDDGYDIADYRNIHKAYGSRRDFRDFVREAHRRGLKVITELVVNHTSDEHPWFRAARHAKPGSARRNFYVWSDTDQKFPETRVIFTDTEDSNWAWDPVAKQYYWHRFFSHQPDLNHNNPQVVKAVIRVMRFWFQMGVDGMRLDAIPYLCVREGTSNENLPETHEVIRQIRQAVDGEFRNRMLLAEANQWPEDVREYFGAGDECHMAYHFPLMPRMYMAIAQEDRYPVVEIMQQTPEIPEPCQWAIFLRNHDELTLEMVTDKERDYMYETYATDPRMRVNVGIRRRLATLMDNDSDRIRLMNSLLLSMPGSPILYYGDELGMGDNIFLGDRNGVRTPMQWSPDRNGGFSRADPQSLFLPPIMDPVYGYEAVNVEAQSREPSSLLNWTRRILAVRKSHKAFGRGTLEFLKPGNRKILAYLREWNGDVLLCVANLARSAQPVELDLSRFQGRVPVELLGRTPFPPIGELPYLLTLPGHGFYWFELPQSAEVPSWHEEHLAREPAPWLVLFEGLASFVARERRGNALTLAERLNHQLETAALPAFLRGQRWFARKDERIATARLADPELWETRRGKWLLAFADVTLETSGRQRYLLPLAASWEQDETPPAIAPLTLARVRQRADTGVVFDAFGSTEFCRDLLEAIADHRRIDWAGGELRGIATPVLEELASGGLENIDVRRPPSEGSNTTLLIGDRLFLKAYRNLRPGTNPEWELGRYLTETSPCACIARVAGALEHRTTPDTEPSTLVLIQESIPNQGDGWTFTEQYLGRNIAYALGTSADAPAATQDHERYMQLVRTLAERTADLHRALARATGAPGFDPEPLTPDDLEAWRRRIAADATHTIALVAGQVERLPAAIRPLAERAAGSGPALGAHLEAFRFAAVRAVRTRYHGDYHLGQVLLVKNDFVITDLEGEPGRTFEERRAKDTPLKDVAGMLRSFRYASGVARSKVEHEQPAALGRAEAWLDDWSATASSVFIEAYRGAMRDLPQVCPDDDAFTQQVLELATLEKLLYEIRYELANRPLWLAVPLGDLLRLLEDTAT